MSQYDFGTINPSTTSGSDLATLLGSWRTALESSHSGTSRPSYAVAGTFWLDTSGSIWVWRFYDGDTDMPVGQFDPTNNVFNARLVDWEPEATVGSAATCDLSSVTTTRVAISGTTGIGSFGSGKNKVKFCRVSGGPIVLTPSTTLITPTGTKNLTLQAGDTFTAISDGSATPIWRLYCFQRADGSDIFEGALPTITVNATSVDLGAGFWRAMILTPGTSTSISSFGSTAALGSIYDITFNGTMTLVNGGTAGIYCLGGANMGVVAGDNIRVRYEGSGQWRVLSKQLYTVTTASQVQSIITAGVLGASGTYNVNASTRFLKVQMVGGGGQGGGYSGSFVARTFGSGGGGEYRLGVYGVGSFGFSFGVTVGAGGFGNPGTGVSGGTTAAGPMAAAGGVGGTTSAGGAGGTGGSGGNIALQGLNGGLGYPGLAATQARYGSGGAGVVTTTSGTGSQNGAAGIGGLFWVEEYY